MSTIRGIAERGYTLVELLVVMTVTLLLTGGLYTALFQSQGTYSAQQDISDLRQQARVVLGNAADELRMAGYDLGSAPERLMDASVDSVALVADIDDGDPANPCDNAIETAVGGGAERVSYRLQGTDLLRTLDCWDGGAWQNEYTDQVAARDLVAAQTIFRYFDENGNELLPGGGTLNAADRDAVRLVEITVDFRGQADQVFGDPRAAFRINTRVRLRNADS